MRPKFGSIGRYLHLEAVFGLLKGIDIHRGGEKVERLVLGILVSLSLHVNATQTCDSAFVASAEAVQAIEFLQSIQGYYEGDTCQVSLEVCSGFAQASSVTGSGQVGELLMVNKKTGREAYMPIVFQQRSTIRTRFAIQNGRRMFHYEFADLNPDPGQGGISVLLFEAVKTDDLARLKYIEFGLRSPKDARIQWSVCQMGVLSRK